MDECGAGAYRPLLRQVLQTALTPVINMLSVAGLVSIPGMLTGQILGGSSPVVAAKYQIMIMFAVAATSTAAVGTAILLATLQLTDAHHCLRLDRLETSNCHAGHVVWCALLGYQFNEHCSMFGVPNRNVSFFVTAPTCHGSECESLSLWWRCGLWLCGVSVMAQQTRYSYECASYCPH